MVQSIRDAFLDIPVQLDKGLDEQQEMVLRNDKFRFESPAESRANLARFLDESVFFGRKPLSASAAQLLGVF